MGDKNSELFDLGGVNAILPEFYYDLLARILPGTVSLLAVLVAAGVVNPTIALERMLTLTTAPVFALYLALGTCGYVIGIILTFTQRGIRWLYIPRVWRQLLKRYRRLIETRALELNLPDLGKDIDSALDPKPDSNKKVRDLVAQLYCPLHDLLKERHPQARFVLDKMNGEAGLCENLVVGLLPASFILCWRAAFTLEHFWRSSEMWSVIGLWLAVIFLYPVAQYRYSHLIERHFSYLSILPK